MADERVDSCTILLSLYVEFEGHFDRSFTIDPDKEPDKAATVLGWFQAWAAEQVKLAAAASAKGDLLT